jgi:hypothetical protein
MGSAVAERWLWITLAVVFALLAGYGGLFWLVLGR